MLDILCGLKVHVHIRGKQYKRGVAGGRGSPHFSHQGEQYFHCSFVLFCLSLDYSTDSGCRRSQAYGLCTWYCITFGWMPSVSVILFAVQSSSTCNITAFITEQTGIAWTAQPNQRKKARCRLYGTHELGTVCHMSPTRTVTKLRSKLESGECLCQYTVQHQVQHCMPLNSLGVASAGGTTRTVQYCTLHSP